MELWNEINLPTPLLQSCTISRKVIDVDRFHQILQDLIDFMGNLEPFHLEAAHLSRLIFMNCKQFRMMSGFHEMRKAHQALLRCLNLDLITTCEAFKGFICEESANKVSVPYRDSLDFILVKLQGLSMLLVRAIATSKKSARFFFGLAKAGNFHLKGAVLISSIASVWSYCREICKFVVQQYSKLMEFREKLQCKPAGSRWVDGDYELPDSLDAWLGADFDNLVVNQDYDVKLLLRDDEILDIQKKMSLFQRVKKEPTEASVAEIPPTEQIEKIVDSKSNELELDEETPISRKAITRDPAKNDHSKSAFTSKDTIKAFIKNESSYRKTDPRKSLTINKMKNKIWKEFKDDIKNKLVLMQEPSFVDYVKDYLKEYKV